MTTKIYKCFKRWILMHRFFFGGLCFSWGFSCVMFFCHFSGGQPSPPSYWGSRDSSAFGSTFRGRLGGVIAANRGIKGQEPQKANQVEVTSWNPSPCFKTASIWRKRRPSLVSPVGSFFFWGSAEFVIRNAFIAKRKVVHLNHWPSRKWRVQIGSLVEDKFCCSWMNLRSFLTFA